MLTLADQKVLKRILALGHELERRWPASRASLGGEEDLTPPPNDEALTILADLKALIASCTQAESSELKRLAFHDGNLTPGMSAKHLVAILVPFERLRNRALRDDEFILLENDAPDKQRSTAPLKVIADNIRSAFNVGAIFRTAECFGAEEVLLSGYSATPQDEKASRTSMGADSFVPWRSFTHAREAIAAAKDLGYKIVALETVEHAACLDHFEWPEKTALLVGNERFGIDQALLNLADHVVRIPVFGKKNSLNVGIAFGIAVADWRKKLARRENSPRRELSPIGIFHSLARQPYEAPRQGAVDQSGEEGYVELHRGEQFEQALADLNGFERLWLLYRFHHNGHWHPKVMPPRGPRTKRGVFATRSPYRPNPIGLSCVELVRIDGLKIYVKGFDLLDGSPIYDIKPYLPYADAFPGAKIGWLEGISETRHDVRFSDHAEQALSWLEAKGVLHLRSFLLAQLEYDPIDDERKRVSARDDGTGFRIAYRTWRADFTWDAETRLVEVVKIASGYSPGELASSTDAYHDKDIHREFNADGPAKFGK